MPKATLPTGDLIQIEDCYIVVNKTKIILNNLPELSDSKSAAYNDEPIIGRASPLKTYSHSENRAIGMQLHFYVVKEGDDETIISYIRALQSACYPQESSSGAPFIPPPVCRIRCGRVLSDGELCVVLKSVQVKYPIDVAWAKTSLLPYKTDVDLSWEVVYSSSALPGQSRIMSTGK